MRRLYSIVISNCLLLFTPFLLSAQAVLRYEAQHKQMGTTFKVTCYSADTVFAAKQVQSIFLYIDSLNFAFSDYLPESELNQLCAQAGNGKWVPVSAALWDILRQSLHFSALSHGDFDVTIGPLTRLWRRARNLKEMPDASKIAEARSKTGFQFLHCAKRSHSVRLDRTGMQLDLGGIAQGWTADACLQRLHKSGLQSACVDAGGDIALGAPPPGESGWPIRVSLASGDTLLHLSACGITTSGATYRFFEHDGVRYSHIVDPKSGIGMTHRNLVTVIAPNATIADAWATACSVGGLPNRRTLRKSKITKVWVTERRLD